MENSNHFSHCFALKNISQQRNSSKILSFFKKIKKWIQWKVDENDHQIENLFIKNTFIVFNFKKSSFSPKNSLFFRCFSVFFKDSRKVTNFPPFSQKQSLSMFIFKYAEISQTSQSNNDYFAKLT